MPTFHFHADLFQHRAQALEALSDAGFEWFVDFASIDLLHEGYGLEVCGIPTPQQRDGIRQVLMELFPDWRLTRTYLRGMEYTRDPGWKFIIHRDVETCDEDWWRDTRRA